MLKRLTTVSIAPVLIILFMLFLDHLQPLETGGLVSPAAAQNGRLVLAFLPYGLAVLGLGIGLRFRSCGVIIAMLSLGSAYLALMFNAEGGTGRYTGDAYRLQALPVLLVGNGLLAAWAENDSWRSRRGWWALLLSVGGLLVFWGDQRLFFDAHLGLGPWLEALGQASRAIIRACLAGLAARTGSDLFWLSDMGGALLVWPAVLFLLVRAGLTHSPLKAGLAGSLAVTAPSLTGPAGVVPWGTAYCAATLMVLVCVLESVYRHAYHDALTDLPGRRSLEDTLRQIGGRFAIAMLDVDHFKRFNDRYGHATGDQVLKMIAAQAGCIRGGQPYRYGGEEFAVVFTGRAAEGAEAALEAFRRNLAQSPFLIRKKPRPSTRARKGRSARRRTSGSRPSVKVTVSIGLAQATGRNRKAKDVLKAADKALYRAKRSGRNRLCRAA